MNEQPIRRDVVALNTFAFMISFAIWVMLGPGVRAIAETLSITPEQAALVKSIPILTGSVMRVPVGILTDRIGPRWTFAGLMWLGAAAVLALPFAHSLAMLIACGLVMGMVGTTFIVGVASVSSWTSRERQGTALGLFGAGNAGTAITTLCMPALLAWFGWETTCIVYGVALALTGVLYAVAVRDRERVGPRRTFGQLTAPLAQPMAWVFGYLYFASFGAFVAMSLMLTDLYVDGYGFDLQTAGAMATVFTLTAALSRIPGGWFADRFGAGPVLHASMVGIALTTVPIAMNPPVAVTVALTFLCALLMGLGMSGTLKRVPEVFPASVGAVGGIVGAIGGMGGFVLPVAAAWTGGGGSSLLPVAATALVGWGLVAVATRTAAPAEDGLPGPVTTK